MRVMVANHERVMVAIMRVMVVNHESYGGQS